MTDSKKSGKSETPMKSPSEHLKEAREVRVAPQVAVDLIKRFEGLRLKAYQDSGGVWTIGYGHTRTGDGPRDVRPGTVITRHQADVILDVDLAFYEGKVDELTRGAGLTDNQFGALVAFAFNLGWPALAGSTLLKKATAPVGSVERSQASAQFDLWVHADGKRNAGLVKRRAAERALFESEDDPEATK